MSDDHYPFSLFHMTDRVCLLLFFIYITQIQNAVTKSCDTCHSIFYYSGQIRKRKKTTNTNKIHGGGVKLGIPKKTNDFTFHVDELFPSSKQIWWSTSGSIIMDYGLVFWRWFEVTNVLMDLFLIILKLLWSFYQLFGLSFWRHPFTAEDPLVSKTLHKFLQIWLRRNKLIYSSIYS